MSNEQIERVRKALAMREAGYEVSIDLDSVAELLFRYDRLRSQLADKDREIAAAKARIAQYEDADSQMVAAWKAETQDARAALAASIEQGKAAADEAKRLRVVLEKLHKAIKPFANAVFNDNGDCTVTPCHDYDSYIAAYFAERKARAALQQTAPASGAVPPASSTDV